MQLFLGIETIVVSSSCKNSHVPIVISCTCKKCNAHLVEKLVIVETFFELGSLFKYIEKRKRRCFLS